MTTRRIPLRRYHIIRDRKRNDYQVVRAGQRTFTSYGFYPTIEDAKATMILAEHKPDIVIKAYQMLQAKPTLPFPIHQQSTLMGRMTPK